MRVLDTHLHLWDPDLLRYDWLSGDLDTRFGPEEFTAAFPANANERAFVFVEADCASDQSMEEVDWISSIAESLGIRGIVAAAPLEFPEQTVDLCAEYQHRPLVIGVRRLLQTEPDGFADSAPFRDGCRVIAERGLVFDACIRSSQLPEITALANAIPALTVVLDHLGNPGIGSAAHPAQPGATPWRDDVRALAELPTVHCKLSGMNADGAAPWQPAQVEPFLDVALAAFGPDRLMFGSDWPVSGRTAGESMRWQDTVSRWAEDRLGTSGRHAVMWTNAERVYFGGEISQNQDDGRSRSPDIPPSTSR